MNIIIADTSGTDLYSLSEAAFLDAELNAGGYDFELIVYDVIDGILPVPSRMYVERTEIGGIIKELETESNSDVTYYRGYTWRGLMNNKIICPPAGEDYKSVSGDLNTILASLINSEFGGLIEASTTAAGINMSFTFDRYCTLLEGIEKMLKAADCRLSMEYDTSAGKVIVSAVPSKDWSDTIELSQDYNMTFVFNSKQDGINHLIAGGKGELSERVILHLYTDADGNISDTKTLTGADELVYFYDYPGAEDADTLRAEAVKKLEELRSKDKLSMNFESTEDINISIGDIVGGRDYKTNLSMSAAVANIICRIKGGHIKKEYQLETIGELRFQAKSLSDYSIINCAVTSDNLLKRSGSRYKSYQVPVTQGWKTVKVKGNANYETHVTFVKSTVPTSPANNTDATQYYCEGETGRHTVSANSTVILDIPADAANIVISYLVYYTDRDCTPAVFAVK